MRASLSQRKSHSIIEILEDRTLMSGAGGGGSGGPPPTPPAIIVPLVTPAPNLSGPGGGGGGGGLNGGGGGGGGGVVKTANPLVGHAWFGLIGATAVAITFNSNNSFTLIDTTPSGQIVTIQGSYTAAASLTTGIGGVPQTQIVLVSQGTVVLSGQASFISPDTMIFTLGSQNVPGAGPTATGVLTVLSAGV